jgi:hypothetical protein
MCCHIFRSLIYSGFDNKLVNTHIVCTLWFAGVVQTTPPMSTYLLAWVMARLTSSNTTCQTEYGPVPLGVWATPSRCALGTTGWGLGYPLTLDMQHATDSIWGCRSVSKCHPHAECMCYCVTPVVASPEACSLCLAIHVLTGLVSWVLPYQPGVPPSVP